MRTTPIPVTVGTLEARRQHEGPKVTTCDDSYQDGGFEAPKTTTVTRMATPKGLIPVTPGTFEAFDGGGGSGGVPLGGSRHSSSDQCELTSQIDNPHLFFYSGCFCCVSPTVCFCPSWSHSCMSVCLPAYRCV